MISETDAVEQILASSSILGNETVPLLKSLGRISASDVRATVSLPSFDNSAMDGYALHADDCISNPSPLKVTGEQPAGERLPLSVKPGECIRIFTGAPIPQGTSAVIMQEDVTREGDTISIQDPASVGEFIRRRGSDLCEGQVILKQGERLTPARIGVLASQGIDSVDVVRKPSVRIISTGSELVQPGAPRTHEGQIYNSNGPLLQALLEQHQLASNVEMLLVKDDMDSLLAALSSEPVADVVILVGGVSVGDHDLVKPALIKLGVATDFWRVSIKPGKPFLYGRTPSTQFFGLPGNPVSAFVTAFLFVLPALRKRCGLTTTENRKVNARLGSDLHNKDRRTTYFRGWLDTGSNTFLPQGLQESHALHTLGKANALCRMEPETLLATGSDVIVFPLD